MGHSHAVSGALAWLALSPMIEPVTGTQLSAVQLGAGAVVCAGAALLPDLDHPQATIAHFLGPISQLLARGVAAAAGGHRQATHSLLGAGLTTAGVWALLEAFGVQAAAIVLFVCTALALRGLAIAPPRSGPILAGLTIALEAAAITWLILRYTPPDWEFLPAAVGLGYLAHLIGDCATPGGCPLGWPHPQRYSLPIITRTGNAVEVALLTPLMTLAAVWLTYSQLIAPVIRST